jgi:hypothetical protein
MREAGVAQRKLLDRMQRIHGQQRRMQAQLRGHGRSLLDRLFGRGRNDDFDTPDWTPADDQDAPQGPQQVVN